jgi:hypothetical protein
LLGDGDARLVVLSAHASEWNLATRLTFSAAQAACRTEVRKQLAGLAATRLKILNGCIAKVEAGKASETCPDAATEGKLAKADAKVAPAQLAKICPAAVVATLDGRGACTSAATTAELAACIRAEATSRVATLLDGLHANAGLAIADKATRDCQTAIASKGGAYFAAIGAGYAACTKQQQKGRVPSCLDRTAAKKVAKARTKLVDAIPKACAAPAVTALTARGFGGSCATAATTTDLVLCESADAESGAYGLVSVLP